MRMNEALRLIAGVFTVLSVILSLLHSKYWLAFTIFVGLNQIQSAFSGWCPMMNILRRLGIKD
ncbi:MAG: DUF2892 domain-containing protein [Candidatus Aenigmatarchaeota archaeon]